MKPVVAATPDQVRETLRSLAKETRVPLAPLSRMVGRPSDYLSRFVRGERGNGLKANEQDFLAEFFRVDPRLFGAREDWEP
ncbi:hypothetical protein ABIC16_002287 [Sphingomonas sp. PvP055]|uniref:peptidase S24 n=1 Tax=Sphingomonas sp. PvP055 TaxID=3156391 RepID=UPI00339568C0